MMFKMTGNVVRLLIRVARCLVFWPFVWFKNDSNTRQWMC